MSQIYNQIPRVILVHLSLRSIFSGYVYIVHECTCLQQLKGQAELIILLSISCGWLLQKHSSCIKQNIHCVVPPSFQPFPCSLLPKHLHSPVSFFLSCIEERPVTNVLCPYVFLAFSLFLVYSFSSIYVFYYVFIRIFNINSLFACPGMFSIPAVPYVHKHTLIFCFQYHNLFFRSAIPHFQS